MFYVFFDVILLSGSFIFALSPNFVRFRFERIQTVIGILIFLSVFAHGKSPNSQSRGQRRQQSAKPNVVLLITDDQDVELGSMEFMPKTLRIMRDGGAEFVNGFVTTPLCCPSRSTILTGMYVHNHHVHSNNENCTGQWWSTLHEPRSVGAYLQKAGYRTGYFGKYLNEYNGTYVPVGWDEWMGLVKNSRFYNYTVNFNGVRIRHGDNYRFDYFTDLVVNDTLTFMRQSLLHHREKPFFTVLSFPAPHGPEDPAPQYSGLFSNVTTHRTPSWNYAPNPDKQWILQHTGKMEPVHVTFTDLLHQRRLQTLLSVDDAIHRVYHELRETGQLGNTYIIFTSDHGYHLGQFGLIKGKMMPYEFDLKVPYFVRGPGIGRGLRLWQPVANIDITPTILDAAGVRIPDHIDGRSFLPLVKYETSKAAGRQTKQQPWRHAILIERGLRPKLLKLRERLQRQKERYSKDMRIQNECDRPQYSAPCKLGQQWECRKNEIGRWRIFKCRGKIILDGCTCPSVPSGEDTNMTMPVTRRHRKSRARRHLVLDGSEEAYEHPVDAATTEELSLLEWEHIAEDGDVAHVSEEQLDIWEEEFFLTVVQRSGNVSDTADVIQECGNDTRPENQRNKRSADATSNGGEKRRVRHSRNQKRMKQSRQDEEGVMLVQGCVLYANHTVHCRPEVYSNYENWLQQKYKVDDRIRILRNRLQDLKGVRKHLKAGKPLEREQLLPKEASFWDSKDEVDEEAGNDDNPGKRYKPGKEEETAECKCDLQMMDTGDTRNHPLRKSSPSVTLPTGPLSDAELLAYAEERRRNRAERKKSRKRQELHGGRRRNEAAVAAKAFCNVPNLNCFTHDNSHWKTPPYWTLGPFCFCQNSNNNTYWCLRNVNATHNFLYCEFVTGFISFYDINKDRYQLNNAIYDLSVGVIEQLSAQLEKLRNCRGAAECDRDLYWKKRSQSPVAFLNTLPVFMNEWNAAPAH